MAVGGPRRIMFFFYFQQVVCGLPTRPWSAWGGCIFRGGGPFLRVAEWPRDSTGESGNPVSSCGTLGLTGLNRAPLADRVLDRCTDGRCRVIWRFRRRLQTRAQGRADGDTREEIIFVVVVGTAPADGPLQPGPESCPGECVRAICGGDPRFSNARRKGGWCSG